MDKTTLVIMAAGLGSRYGGVKQIEGLGPKGEILMEYSIHDAVRAGFDKAVVIIKPEMLGDVKRLCGDRISKLRCRDGSPFELRYAFQDFSSVPARVPPERTKPFGTVHALLCARDEIAEPFAVINADDYYGVPAFSAIREEILKMPPEGHGTMVAYRLKNTVSENGAVTRGICEAENGLLTQVTETYKIKVFPDGTIRDTATDEAGVILDPLATVSMNFWGFTPWIFGPMETYFRDFLAGLPEDELKKECLLPVMADDMIKSGSLKVSMLTTGAKWFGITYKEDRALASQELQKLHNEGVYPPTLKEC